jgi:hypothetical protein
VSTARAGLCGGTLSLTYGTRTGSCCRLRSGQICLKAGGLAGLTHLPRACDVDPRVAVYDEVLWQAAKVPVIIWRLDIGKAGTAIAY